MQRDYIAAIGIDHSGRLWVKPEGHVFDYVYREGMEVQWDAEGEFLYSPAPREWTYLRWFQQIVAAVRVQGWQLCITDRTRWDAVPEDLRRDFEHWLSQECA